MKNQIIKELYSQISKLEITESNQKLEAICLLISKQIKNDDSFISEERKIKLANVIEFAKSKINENLNLNFTFICIHNSRRSHFSEVWFHIASLFNNLKSNTYSGGTAETACNDRVISSFKRFGLDINIINTTQAKSGIEFSTLKDNPLYSFNYKESEKVLFSKVYDNQYNPSKNFAAVMVCSEAETNCPYVFAADSRLSLPFGDPSEFDNTELENEGYDQKSIEIALEMFYIVNKINKINK